MRAQAAREYRRFPNVRRRNLAQELLEVPLVVRLLGLQSRRRILEIGCGRGIALPVLQKMCNPRWLVGVDIDREALSEALGGSGAAGSKACVVESDVRRLPFPDGCFDAVIDFGTCYHIGGAEKALREIERVICSGGIFVYETPASQMMSHPIRSLGRRLPWREVPGLRPYRSRLLWASRIKTEAA